MSARQKNYSQGGQNQPHEQKGNGGPVLPVDVIHHKPGDPG